MQAERLYSEKHENAGRRGVAAAVGTGRAECPRHEVKKNLASKFFGTLYVGGSVGLAGVLLRVSHGILGRVPDVGVVLVRVEAPVLDVLEDGVEASCQERAHERAEPVL